MCLNNEEMFQWRGDSVYLASSGLSEMGYLKYPRYYPMFVIDGVQYDIFITMCKGHWPDFFKKLQLLQGALNILGVDDDWAVELVMEAEAGVSSTLLECAVEEGWDTTYVKH